MAPTVRRPERTASRSAEVSSSRTPRVPGVMLWRRSRCRSWLRGRDSALTELAHELMSELNHENGPLRS
ncbi:Uncharacterised protein [Mycobacteroides abscessus subsp. abscessus]|nr:Uncharacterised protein [Mycobacteroides abscessus subsp. abscessus]